MKTVSIFWKNDSDELRLLPQVPVATSGNNGMEVVGSDTSIDMLVSVVNANEKALYYELVRPATELDLQNAVEFSYNNWPNFETTDEVRRYIDE